MGFWNDLRNAAAYYALERKVGREAAERIVKQARERAAEQAAHEMLEKVLPNFALITALGRVMDEDEKKAKKH